MSEQQTEVVEDATVEPVEPVEPVEEVEEVEPDGATDDDPAESPGDVQQPDEEPMDEKELEKAFKALGKVRELVARRVGDILGDDATQLIPCPTCSDLAPGFVWPPNVAPLSPEAEAGTRLLLGMQKPADLKPHPNAVLCETCDGAGQVETPSRVPGYDIVDCPNCAATGRILTSNVVPISPTAGNVTPPPVVTGPTVTPQQLPPEAEALKAQGYMVVPPFDPGAGQTTTV